MDQNERRFSSVTNITFKVGLSSFKKIVLFVSMKALKNHYENKINFKNFDVTIWLTNNFNKCFFFCFVFFSIWVFFHEHSPITGQQGKEEGIYLTALYHFHLLHKHLYISRAITAESSPLHIAGSRIWTGNLWFLSRSR